MTTRNRTKTNSTRKSQFLLNKSNGSAQKTPLSLPELENVSQVLPNLENTSMSPSPSPSTKDSQNLNQSLPKVTSGSGVSAAAQRKLTAEEVKFAKLKNDLQENVGSIGGILLVIGQARNNQSLYADGMVILQNNEKLCTDLTALAEKYEYVYKGLNTLVQATVWGAVISDVAAIAIAIAGNHGVSIPGLSGASQELQQAAA